MPIIVQGQGNRFAIDAPSLVQGLDDVFIESPGFVQEQGEWI